MHRAAAALAAAACFSASILSIAWAWADLTARAAVAGQDIQAVASADAESLKNTLYRLQQSRALNPLNADYAFELARFQSWLAWRSLGQEGVAKSYWDAAAENYRDAVRLRPSWGFAWVSLAEANVLAGRDDEETRRALTRAMTLAPWEPAVQIKILLVGFSLWDNLSDQLRAATLASLRRALFLDYRVDHVIQLAIHKKRTEELVGLLTNPRHRKVYERLAASADAS